ncbi:MAG: ComEC family competence protein [Saprospiraceae bacterium]|nr:ComEC family competence protein [Saprospiraceae bacterium]
MHPRHIPFVRLLLPWGLGILLGAWLNRPFPGLALGLVAGFLLLLFLAKRRYAYRFRWLFGGLAGLLLLGAGYFHTVWHDERMQPDHFARQCPGARVFVGVVYDAPSRGNKLKIPLRLEAAGRSADSLRACSGQVLLFAEISAATEGLRYGDRLWVQADLRPVNPVQNPHAFDYQRYLHFQNIHFQAFVKEGSYKVIATGLGHLLWRMAFRWRDRLLGILHEHFPGADEYAVASALLVGYKDELSEDLRTAYAETGSMHALAVSGTHVGLLYAGLLFLLRRLPWSGRYRRWGETVLVLVAIWLFTLVTGATASVLRASVMFSAFLLGKAIRRQASVWNILAASAFGLLWLNPYVLFDAGFQLSYAAVAGMVFFYPIFQKQAPSLPKWAAEGYNILLIGVAAQLGTLPLSLYYFHQFPTYFWLAGWVVVLGGAVFLWCGAILVLLNTLAPAAAAWLAWALYYLIWGMNYLIQQIQGLPGSVWSGIWLTAGAALLLYVLIGLLSGAFLLRRPGWLLCALLVFSVLGLGRAARSVEHYQQRRVTLYALNRHFLLDMFDGTRAFACTDTLPARQEKFAAQANRWAHGIELSVRVNLSADTLQTYPHVQIENGVVHFFSKKIAIVQQLPSNTVPVVPVDALIIRGNPSCQIQEAIRHFPAALLVFDASNSPWRTRRWKAECAALGLAWHDVREQGAWETSF